MKHARGPWEAGWGNGITGPNAAHMISWDNKYPIIIEGTKKPIAAVPMDDQEYMLNAKLIAAAPELLEALEWALPYVERIRSAEIIREAIAKAKGND